MVLLGVIPSLDDPAGIPWLIVTILMILAGVVGPIFALALTIIAIYHGMGGAPAYFLCLVMFVFLMVVMILNFTTVANSDPGRYLVIGAVVFVIGALLAILLGRNFHRAYQELT